MVAIDDEPNGFEFFIQAAAAYAMLVDTLDNRRALGALIEFLLFVRCHVYSIPFSASPQAAIRKLFGRERFQGVKCNVKTKSIFFSKKISANEINMSLQAMEVMHILPQCENNFAQLESNLQKMRRNHDAINPPCFNKSRESQP